MLYFGLLPSISLALYHYAIVMGSGILPDLVYRQTGHMQHPYKRFITFCSGQALCVVLVTVYGASAVGASRPTVD